MAHNTHHTPTNTDSEQPPAQTPQSAPKKPSHLANTVREWWTNAWTDGGVLHARWEEIRTAPQAGWHGMTHWIKATLALTATCVLLILLNAAAGVITTTTRDLLAAAPTVRVGTDTSSGIWGVIDNPVRTYIAHHSTHLPIHASTLYTCWQLTGLFGLLAGFAGWTGARLTWTAWGATTIAMVWSTTPAGSRTLATAAAVLAWTIASTLALRGLNLRPTVINQIINSAPDIKPQIHIPAPASPPADDTPNNVHPLQR